MATIKPLTMGADLSRLVSTFHASQKAHARALESLSRAKKAAEKAEASAADAKAAMDKAKAAMQSGFLQEVDPMPLVPAPRPENLGLTAFSKAVLRSMATGGLISREEARARF
jgi:hypothetical protein